MNRWSTSWFCLQVYVYFFSSRISRQFVFPTSYIYLSPPPPWNLTCAFFVGLGKNDGRYSKLLPSKCDSLTLSDRVDQGSDCTYCAVWSWSTLSDKEVFLSLKPKLELASFQFYYRFKSYAKFFSRKRVNLDSARLWVYRAILHLIFNISNLHPLRTVYENHRKVLKHIVEKWEPLFFRLSIMFFIVFIDLNKINLITFRFVLRLTLK